MKQFQPLRSRMTTTKILGMLHFTTTSTQKREPLLVMSWVQAMKQNTQNHRQSLIGCSIKTRIRSGLTTELFTLNKMCSIRFTRK